MINKICLLAAALLSLTGSAWATFPTTGLDSEIFNYSSDQFMGDYFSFGTNLTYSIGTFGDTTDITTGLTGFSAPSDQIVPIPGFQLGDNVPLGGQGLNDLFMTTPPDALQDASADNTISAVGDFSNGFSEFAIHQHKLSSVAQEDGIFNDAFVESKANAPFQIASEETSVDALFSVNLDSLFLGFGNGAVSEGIAVQLLNITDPDNVTVMNEVSGFYFQLDVLFDASFSMGDSDLSDNFTVETIMPPGGTEDDLVNQALFSYEMAVELDPTQTYALNVQSDISAGVDGAGSAFADSSNTLDARLQMLSNDARFLIPGTTMVPEPGTLILTLFSLTTLTTCNRRSE